MKTIYKISSFRDFSGQERDVVACAINDENYVSIGVAIQNPRDVSDITLGKIIAKGKAVKKPVVDIHIDGIPINYGLGVSLLDAFIVEFKKHPENYISGYSKDKALFILNPMAYKLKFGHNDVPVY